MLYFDHKTHKRALGLMETYAYLIILTRRDKDIILMGYNDSRTINNLLIDNGVSLKILV